MQHAEQGKQVAAGYLPTKGAGMTDIVERLGNCRTVHMARLHLLMEEAADEMERLRADWPEQLQAHSVLIAEQEMEIERLRQVAEQKNLTDEERDVLREVRHGYADVDDVRCNEIAFVIDRLLARLGAANSTPIHRDGCGESRAGSASANVGEHAAKCTVASAKCPERERVANHPASPDSSTLTAAEREAVQRARDSIAATMPYESVQSAADWKTLGGLLDRLGGER